MGKKLYVGNLPYSVRDSDLEDLFAAHGSVQSAQVIIERDTGRSKGFGFVEMSNDQEAQEGEHAAGQREQEELDRRVATVFAPPNADQKEERNERELEEHIKQEDVAGGEDPQAAALQE